MRIVFAAALMLLALSGCGPSPREKLGFDDGEISRSSLKFARGQKIDYAAYSAGLGKWLRAHEGKVHINCIVPLDYGVEGTTTEFLIVYEEQ